MSVFRGRHTPRLLQMLQEANLTWLQENQALALAMCTSCRATNSVDVIPRIIRWINLQDPVYSRDIQPSSGNIGTDESALSRIAEFEEGVCAFLLLLLAVK